MRSITSEIEIAAPAAAVWSVLTDFPSYPEWNPFIRRLEGALVVGGRLEVVLQPDGKGPTTLRPTVEELVPGRSFSWLGHVLMPGVLDGRHQFEIVSAGPDASRFVQSESFTGMLAPLFGSTYAAAERSFKAMNELVKRRAEAATHLHPAV